MTNSEREILAALWSLFDHRRAPSLEGLDDSVPLPPQLLTVVENRLSEFGYYLGPDVEIFGLLELPGKRVQYHDGILAMDRRTLGGGRIKREVLLYDLPFEAIYRPACGSKLSHLGPKPVDLASHALTLQSVFRDNCRRNGNDWKG